MRKLVPSLALAALAAPSLAGAYGLGGSPESMLHQHAIAVQEKYSFLRTPADVRKQEAAGRLVSVVANADFTLSKVSFPSARPEVLSFIQLFAARYHDATGARLVITSLTRPAALQPRNAHKLSVHPAGMAVDLRVPADSASRAWLEKALLAMEQDGLLDVTREKSPAHYHVAVFGEPFLAYAAKAEAVAAGAREAQRVAAVAKALAAPVADVAPTPPAPALLAGLSLLAVAFPVTRRVRERRRRLSSP